MAILLRFRRFLHNGTSSCISSARHPIRISLATSFSACSTAPVQPSSRPRRPGRIFRSHSALAQPAYACVGTGLRRRFVASDWWPTGCHVHRSGGHYGAGSSLRRRSLPVRIASSTPSHLRTIIWIAITRKGLHIMLTVLTGYHHLLLPEQQTSHSGRMVADLRRTFSIFG